MADFIQKLFFGAGLDVSGLSDDAGKIETRLSGMGKFAQDTFQKQIARELARSISPENFQKEANQARQAILNFSNDAKKIFENTLGANQAKRIFDPIRNEANTFKGQLRASLGEAFDFKKIAAGSLLGFVGANLIQNVVGGLVDIGKQTVQLAADAAETRSKFDVVFGDLADDTRNFANTFADSVGRARIDTEQFLSSFQGLIEPLGFTNKESAEFSKTLTKLAVDVASFNNALDADVVRDFQSAIVGESEPVKKYGIIINETRIKQEALNLGIIKAGEALTEQQKVYVRYQVLLKDTTAAQGDALRTADSLVNQQKALAANFKNVAESIGAALIPSVNAFVQGLNSLLSSSTATEKLSTDLQKLGVAAEQVEFLNLIAASERAQRNIVDLTGEINKLIESTEFLEDKSFAGLGFGKRGIIGSFIEGETVGDVAKQAAQLAETEAGRAELTKQIADSTARLVALSKEYGEISLGIRQGDADAVKKQIDAETTRNKTLTQVLGYKEAITRQEQAAAAAQEEAELALGRQRGIVFDAVAVEAKRLEQTTLTAAQQKEIAKHAEEAAKFIADAANKMELLAAIDEPERRLIAIRQQADEDRKRFAGQAKAIEAVNKLERAERKKTIDDFEKQLEKEIKNRIDKIVKFDIEPKLITDLKLPDIEFDEQKTKTIGERINKTLNETLVESPASIVLNKITELGPLLDDEFINFVGVIDEGLANVLSGIADFAANIASGNILGAITGAVGVLGGLFGGGSSAKKRAEAERREQQAQEEAARSAEKAAQALENLRRAAEELGAGPLRNNLDNLIEEFERITNASRELTSAEIDRAAALIEEIPALRNNIQILRDAIARATDPRQIAEFQRQLAELQGKLSAAEAALAELGIDLNEITALELERIKVLLEEKGIYDEALKSFGAFGDGMRGLIERLQFGFDFIATEPAKKLEELLKAVNTTFGFKVPEQFDSLQEFILAAVEAMKAGGQTLIDFLIGAGLEELTAAEFADFLRLLDEFSKDVEKSGGDVASAFEKFLEGFGFATDILDVEEPKERLQAFRRAINTAFGAEIPESFAAMKEFILNGFIALQGDAESLKAFMASLGLEELTREEFENLLHELEGGLDAIASKFAEMTDQLNLQFDLLDIDDPIEKLKKLQSEILKRFGAIIPTTKEEIDALIASGVEALLAGGDALKMFLASIDLEELTAAEFEELLRRLKDFGEEAAAQIEDATQTAEEITTSQVKSITFTQGNKLIDEVITMRVVLTQMLNEMRGGLLGTFNNPNVNFENLAAALTGLNSARNNYFIVRNGNAESISENQLSDIDRRLIEQARRAAQARGVS